MPWGKQHGACDSQVLDSYSKCNRQQCQCCLLHLLRLSRICCWGLCRRRSFVLSTAFLLRCTRPSTRLLLMPNVQLEMSDIKSRVQSCLWLDTKPSDICSVTRCPAFNLGQSPMSCVQSRVNVTQAQGSMHTRVFYRCSLESTWVLTGYSLPWNAAWQLMSCWLSSRLKATHQAFAASLAAIEHSAVLLAHCYFVMLKLQQSARWSDGKSKDGNPAHHRQILNTRCCSLAADIAGSVPCISM